MFSEFKEMPFPDDANIVYVLCFKFGQSGEPVPFYVGQTSINVGRLGDYVSAKFTAATDFKVGKAVKLFRERGWEVIVRYRPSSARLDERLQEEKDLKQRLEDEGYDLLNNLPGYPYRTAIEEQELGRVAAWVERQTAKAAKVTCIVPLRKRNRSSVETAPESGKSRDTHPVP